MPRRVWPSKRPSPGDDEVGVLERCGQACSLHDEADAGGEAGAEERQCVTQSAGRACAGLFALVGQTAGGEDGGVVGKRRVQFGDGGGIRAFLRAEDGAGAVCAAERVVDVAGDVEGDGL